MFGNLKAVLVLQFPIRLLEYCRLFIRRECPLLEDVDVSTLAQNVQKFLLYETSLEKKDSKAARLAEDIRVSATIPRMDHGNFHYHYKSQPGSLLPSFIQIQHGSVN